MSLSITATSMPVRGRPQEPMWALGSASSAECRSGGSTVMDAASPDMSIADAGSSGDGGWDPGVPAYPGKPGIYLCPADWNQQKCCELLCSCLQHICTDSPMDKGRIPMCMSTCMNVNEARSRCLVYHCFESASPSGMKDHVSHCGHASGRVGGGSCTIIK